MDSNEAPKPSSGKGNFISRELAHNKDVTARLKTITEEFKSPESAEGLLESLRSYPEDYHLAYQNTIAWIASAIGALALATVILLIVNGNLEGWVAAGLCVVAVIPFIFVLTYLNKNRKRHALLESFFNRYEEIKYGFTYGGDQENISFNDNTALFSNAFRRGNYKNYFPVYASGATDYEGKSLNYTLFTYKFVNRARRTKTVKRKKVQYFEYDYYKQWGVFVSDVNVPAFSISSFTKKHYPEVWTTSDDRFNQKYYVSASSEIEIAKLMQPANVLMFEKVLESLPRSAGSFSRSSKGDDIHNFHPPLSSTELVGSRETPSLYWNINLNPFERTSTDQPKLDTPAALAGYLETIFLENFDQIFDSIQPLFKKVIKK
ncbi:hypothetical protein [Idiomarina ramblicola]|uniref:DUF3137 domain-containing protein n=1 Tax=Idiomarina ramblicola TaxID=263724 RepID=A0A432Z1I3_9GAMM|nr:hypothetical protein [Idiomarina ramblicola]RUO71764.1 hypothetical protein CWI78_04405 [Idiomarina ramblicola]